MSVWAFSWAAAMLAWGFAVLGWYFTARRNDVLQKEMRFRLATNHAMCIAHVSHYTGNAFAREVLYAAAEDFDAVQSIPDINRLKREHKSGDPSIPAQWLRERAEDMDPSPVNEDGVEFHNYGGDKIL